MKHRKRTKKKVTQDLDPVALAKETALKRQRRLMARALLKRRRRKSGQ